MCIGMSSEFILTTFSKYFNGCFPREPAVTGFPPRASKEKVYGYCWLKLEFHDTDTDILARMSVSVSASWNAGFTVFAGLMYCCRVIVTARCLATAYKRA